MKKTLISICLLTVLGCSGIYHMDVQQGNLISNDSLSQLRTGMTKTQVEYLLGTALIQDSFHPDRWDYLYLLEQDNKDAPKRHMVVYFDGNTVSRIEPAS